ncbi:toxin-activating lysine-acyltransferase [Stappia sp. P2PMeth1]|uniref:toxin-activating lysine-acyltransferase n=1 Tax=Stappia sp. P2PMeth1 TaxID=2003586 RepID=UPI0016497867|nr:toxin-activating lysine-acyltransferase [Stappia sp. P2PMeth1]
MSENGLGAEGTVAASVGRASGSGQTKTSAVRNIRDQAAATADGDGGRPEGFDANLSSKVREINAGFGEIVSLLARDPRHRHMSLGDLEWAVMPPLRAGQFLTMRGKIKDRDDLSVPLAVALWAKVSPEVDAKLEAQRAAGVSFRLAPHEWTSGEIPWLLLTAGANQFRIKLADQLTKTLGSSLRGIEPGDGGVDIPQ